MSRSMFLYLLAFAMEYAGDHGDHGSFEHIVDACRELYGMLVECYPMSTIRETHSYQIIMAFSVGEGRGENGNGKHKEVWE